MTHLSPIASPEWTTRPDGVLERYDREGELDALRERVEAQAREIATLRGLLSDARLEESSRPKLQSLRGRSA